VSRRRRPRHRSRPGSRRPRRGPGAGPAGCFSDTTVSSRKTYQYRVYAYNQYGNSSYSNVAQPTAAAPVPEALALPSKAARNLLYGRRPSAQALDQVLLLWAEHGFFGD